jgi:outer membrane protein TolC
MDFVGDLEFIKSGTLLGLTALEPVYTGGRLTSYNKLADLQVDAREKLISVTDDQIVQTTQFLYYKIVEMHDLDKTFASIEEELKSIHQDAVNIYENGIVNKNDVLSVELMQDQVSALRIKTANACRLLRRALAKYMGMANEDIDVDTRIDTDISDPETLRTSPLEATLNRTETQLLDIWVQKSQLESKIAKANMLPIVLVGGSLNYNKVLSNWQGKAIAFATLQMPISALWSERHEYKRKKIEEQKALDFRQDKRELITLQIMDAWDNLESAYRQTQIAEKSIVRAEENLRIQREYYRNGLTNMTILLDAQRQQQTALTQRATAVSEYLQAKTKYLILTGRRNY